MSHNYDRHKPLTGEQIAAMRAYLDEHPVKHWPPAGLEFFDILRICATLEFAQQVFKRFARHRTYCAIAGNSRGTCNCGFREAKLLLLAEDLDDR